MGLCDLNIFLSKQVVEFWATVIRGVNLAPYVERLMHGFLYLFHNSLLCELYEGIPQKVTWNPNVRISQNILAYISKSIKWSWSSLGRLLWEWKSISSVPIFIFLTGRQNETTCPFHCHRQMFHTTVVV